MPWYAQNHCFVMEADEAILPKPPIDESDNGPVSERQDCPRRRCASPISVIATNALAILRIG
jgi:hypothetical protein